MSIEDIKQNQCASHNELVAEVQRLKEIIAKKDDALKFYAEGRHLSQESEYHPKNVSETIGTTARRALALSEDLK